MLSVEQCRSLHCLAEMMIPASAEYAVPSAGGETIFDKILQSLGGDAGPAIAVLQRLDALSGDRFADLDLQRRDAVAARWRETGGGALTHLTRIILQCCCRDDRVIRSLGMEPGRRFPKASMWNKATSPCWIQCASDQSFIATRVDENWLSAGNSTVS